MPSYAAFLGHQPHISIAELAAVVPGFALRTVLDKKIALFESADEIDETSFNELGGCIALARRVDNQDLSVSDVPSVLLAELSKVRGKVTFGLRTFGLQPSTVHELYRRYKMTLKEEGRSVRYVGNERKPAAAVLLHDSGLLTGKHGCELTLIQLEQELWVGRTIAAQDIDAYVKRDIDKPVRDTRAGLLPPKLAQTLLNLGSYLARACKADATETKKKKPKHEAYLIFDPFCGTGVIPIECLVRGWPVLASDVSQKAVSGCEKNLEWIRKELKILKKDTASTVWKQDATKAFALKTPPNVIVTETSLGPALTKRPAVRDAQKMVRDAEELEEKFLRNAAATLPGVPIVCTWPAWYMKTGQLRLEKIWGKLDDIGYKAVLPAGFTADNPERPSLLYRRVDQLVGREIVMLMPKGK